MAETKKRRDRGYYLNAGADLLAREAYRYCKAGLRAGAGEDLKTLKELCGLLKEAAALAGTVEKAESSPAQTLTVVFDALAEDYAR